MTREEAKEFIAQSVKSDVDMALVADAIKTLDQEPCEDAVSRKAVINQIFYSTDNNGDVVLGSALRERIARLPSVTPQLADREFKGIEVNYPPEKLCTYPEYKGKPYFGIKYKENGEEIVGYGTYKPEILSQYLKDYFISTTKNDLAVDCIDREELLKAMDTWDKFGYTETGCFVRAPKNDYVPYVHYDDMVNCVKGMPSVTPQEPFKPMVE